MKRTLYLISLFLAAAACTDPVVEPENGNISGIVADKTTGEPVPVVNVKIKETGFSTVTGTDGSFSFRDLEEDTYTILISKDGYKDNSASVRVSNGKTTESHLLIERIPAVLTIDREVLDFGDNVSNNTLSFSIVNKNYVDLDWEIVYNSKWIKDVDPMKSAAKLGYGKTQTIVVTIDRDALEAGANETALVVRTTDGSSELKVKAVGQEKRLPALNVLETKEIKATSAILNAEITDKGVPEYTERGFVLSDSEMPTKETAHKVIAAAIDNEASFSVRAGDLTVGKTYYVRAYAVNSTGTAYSSNQDKFTTVAVLAEVSTLPATSEDRDTRSAVLHGSISYEGDPAYTERGFVWSTVYESPTTEENKVVVEGTGSNYEKRVTFPEADKPKYVRAYVINQKGIAYGETITVFPYIYYADKTMNIGVQNEDIGYGQWEAVNSMCQNSRVAGQGDWRLPTKNELMYLYTNRDKIGGFSTSYVDYNTRYAVTGYWSSTIDGDSHVIISMMDGSVVVQDDNTWEWESTYVNYIHGRCVRTLE